MALSEETMLKCSVHLSAYKSACEDHPDLKSFDASLQQKTVKAIDSLTDGHEAHKNVSQRLLQVSQDVLNFILESKDDVWESKALRSLVQAYFDNTMKTLKIFDNVMECVDKAELGQLYIREAMAEFEKESEVKDVGGKKYEETVKELMKFKAMKDPFDGQLLTTQFELIKNQQESLLSELCVAKTKIAEEHSAAHKASILSNALFGAAFALAAVASISVMAVAVGVAAPFAVLLVPVLALGWVGVSVFLERKMKGLKKQEEDGNKEGGVAESVEKGTEINEESLKTVSELVDEL
ncbi:PREDICTED: UPF0496 protein At3g28270-like [Camelina sativa]|uniref:UPF0496 protein At3g28270-like n=1 Tax=Camelina sativa TaxID=90675 RepID=A0ABM0YWW1_CAMSA|nr:PREDICTED: UPF0496 protein At3g28270-like [Camelina sativa]